MHRLAAALTSLCLLVDVAWLARSAKLAANTFAWGSDDGAEIIRRPGLGALAVELGERSPALFLGVMVALALAWIDAWRWGGRAPGTRLGALLAFAMAASLLTLGPLFWLAPELHYVWTPHSWARTSTVAASAALAVFVLAAVAFADGRPSASAIVIALLAPALAWVAEQLALHHFNCFHYERMHPTASRLWTLGLCVGPLLIVLSPVALRWRCRRGAAQERGHLGPRQQLEPATENRTPLKTSVELAGVVEGALERGAQHDHVQRRRVRAPLPGRPEHAERASTLLLDAGVPRVERPGQRRLARVNLRHLDLDGLVVAPRQLEQPQVQSVVR